MIVILGINEVCGKDGYCQKRFRQHNETEYFCLNGDSFSREGLYEGITVACVLVKESVAVSSSRSCSCTQRISSIADHAVLVKAM